MTRAGRRSLSHVAAVVVVLGLGASAVAAARAGSDSPFMGGTTVDLRTATSRTDTQRFQVADAAVEQSPAAVEKSPAAVEENPAAVEKSPAAVEESPASPPAAPAVQEELGRIHIEYVPPKKPAHQKTYQEVRKRRVLERTMEIFGAFRLPEELYVKAIECNSKPNTYFDREDERPTVKVCYEYLKGIHDKMPKKPTRAGITPHEVLVGQFVFAAAHELGHALFDVYNLPIFGRQEDAADQFATYFILQFGGERARRLILGAAYAYRGFVKQLNGNPKVTLPLAAFSSDHGQPEQRFYNLVCISYGYDPKLFAGAVNQKWLPLARAKVCQLEYQNLRYAMKTLINPHIDQTVAKKLIDTGFAPASDPPEPVKSAPRPAK